MLIWNYCISLMTYINTAEILEIVLSPKDLQVKGHDSALLTCMFKSSTHTEVIWENEAVQFIELIEHAYRQIQSLHLIVTMLHWYAI